MLINLASDGTITIQKAAEKAGMDVASFEKRMKEQYEDERLVTRRELKSSLHFVYVLFVLKVMSR